MSQRKMEDDMSKMNCAISFFLSALLLLSFGTASAQISIMPHGFGLSLEENGDGDTELMLVNDYEDPVTFSIKTDLIEEDEGRDGPRRDDPGELLRQFNSPINNVGGMCFDGDLLWGGGYQINSIAAMTLEGEVVHNFDSNPNPLSMTFDGEIIWASNWDTNQIFTYDLEGNRIDQFNMNFSQISGMASDRDQYVFMNSENDNQIHVISIENHQEITTFEFLGAMGNSDVWGIEWVPEHRDGQLWGNDRGHLYQAFVDEEWNVEAVSDFAWNTEFQHCEPAHDGENMWHGSWEGNTWYMFDDGVEEFHMLSFNPEEGELPGEDSIPIEVFVTTEGIDPGAYNILITCETDRECIEITAIITVDFPSAFLTCRVIDAETEEVIPDITVDIDMYNIQRSTNRNGNCDFEELPVGNYEFTFTSTDYLTLVEPYRIDGEGEVAFNVELLHSECNPSRDNIATVLHQGDWLESEITVSNDGNGPLVYTTEKRLIGDANADPWELRNTYPTSEITGDTRLQGVVFINDLFYFAGSNNREPQIYVLNREGELINQFEQCGAANNGYKDLAWDGELIWGSGEANIFGFTPQGELVTEFNSGMNPCTNLTWDCDREVLWVSSTTTDISGFDREGNRVEELSRQDLRVYGLAYWPDDPDGYQLYLFHKMTEIGNQLVSKMNVENGDILDVTILAPEVDGNALGCFITNQYDIYSWVFLGNVNNGGDDRLDIWQVDARKDWMDIDPEVGIVEAGEEQNFMITLDATGLPEAVFEGEIVFMHDGVGSETIITLTLEVEEGQGGQQDEEMNLFFIDGWNMVSAYVQPDPDNVVEIMSELVEADQLLLMKNGIGRFYNPAFNFNNIPGWLVNEGYMVNVDGDAEMMINGNPVNPDDPLQLIAGWQIASYYPRQGIDAVTALSGIVDFLLIAKDGLGRFYNPEFNFSNMGNMIPGQGYLLNVSEETELIYTLEEEIASAEEVEFDHPIFLPVLPATGENMSLLVIADGEITGEIGVYINGNLVGSGIIKDGRSGIAVWGDDITTSEIDGALEGQVYSLVVNEDNRNYTTEFEIIKGDGHYTPNGFEAVNLLEISAPDEFGIVSAFPNPFNHSTNISYNLPETDHLSIALFDLHGRMVTDLVSGEISAGQHIITLDGKSLSSGVYIIQLESSNMLAKQKVTLIR
ncbi:MAG: T9SS type A sorting domain-containing protein [Calditrichaeota bacterium]|nr:T9SS type A sorting domain-containing protein [Calditrichota bacterium]